MNTLKIIAFHPERLREMILGNERKNISSLLFFSIAIYLLTLALMSASFSMIPVRCIDAVAFLETSKKEKFFKRFGISEEESTGGKWAEYFLPYPDPRIQKIKSIAGTTSAQGVGQFLIDEGNELGRYLLNAVDKIQTMYDMTTILVVFFIPFVAVVSGLFFSLFVSSPSISFKQTFYLYCYVTFFWFLLFDAPIVIQLIDYESALVQWFANFATIGLIILSTVHFVWFFNRSHDNSRLKVFGALVGSAVISYALLFGFFFLIMVVYYALFPPVG